MKASVLLCDAAQAVDGKLYILGGGIALVGSPSSFAVAITAKVPWSGAHEQHTWKLDLVDADGDVVDLGGGPISIGGEFRVAPSIDAQPGMTLSWPFAVNFAMVPLAAGSQYQFNLTIDNVTDEGWCVDFWTRSASASQAQAG